MLDNQKDQRCLTKDNLKTGEPTHKDKQIFDKTPSYARFYYGHEWNPRLVWDRVDVKMFLYVVGAV